MNFQPYYYAPVSQTYHQDQSSFHPTFQPQQPNQPFMRQQVTTQDLNELRQEITRLNDEIVRLNTEINRINEEIMRLNSNDELHTDRLTRLNQRLRTAERRLNIPYTGGNDGF